MTLVVRVDRDRPDPSALAPAADCLRRGGLVAFPTETVYGLGVHALNREAVLKLFEAKGRPADDPLIVHIAEFTAIAPLVESMPEAAGMLAARFWPGPLTLVLPRGRHVPLEVTAGLDTVAVRIPSHPVARALLTVAAIPVAAPSANLFSRPSPTRAAHVLEDLDGRIDLVIDGGAATVGVESTVIDLTTPIPAILRPGAVTMEMLQTALPGVGIRNASVRERGAGMKSPGLLSRHYSPRAELTLYEGPTRPVLERIIADATNAVARGQRVGVVAADEDELTAPPVVRVARLGSERNHKVIAANLYNTLRSLDAEGVDVILARTFADESGLTVAIHDRLRRAAAGRIIRVEG